MFIHKKDSSLGHESLYGGGILEDRDMNTTTEQSSFIQEICRANDNAVYVFVTLITSASPNPVAT